jgi:sialic acid synthase SpsE
VRPYVIAEIGSNWKMSSETSEYDDVDNALICIKIAQECGADAVKFQMFDHRTLYGVNGNNEFSLNPDWIPDLEHACHEFGIDFMCTAFDCLGIIYLDDYVKMHKIASSSLSNDDMLDTVIVLQKPFLYSNGMVEADFPNNRNAIPLLCASAYPAQPEDYDLTSIGKIINAGEWGLSDHTKTNTLAKICRAHGATYFEKHFNPLGNEHSPDATTSVGINELKSYINAIHSITTGRPFQVRSHAKALYSDRYNEDFGRFVRPLIKEN